MNLFGKFETFCLGITLTSLVWFSFEWYRINHQPDFTLTECEKIAENYRTQTGYYDIFNCKEGILQIEEKGDWR